MAADRVASETEPFDPLSEGRAGDPASHVTLLQRGRVLKQLREELRRRESYSVTTRRVSTALLGSQTRKPMSTRRLLIPTEAPPTISEGLADFSTVVAPSNSGDGGDAETLVRAAVLALWTNYRVSMGFRRWKEATMSPRDLSRFGSDVDLTHEARKTLVSAEAERAAAVHAPPNPHDEEVLVISPRTVDKIGVRLSRDELDLLTVWAKEVQAKTFRSVDDASICEVMRCLRFRTYQDGESLFYEGETGETFYIIFQGTVAVFVGMPATTKAALSSLHGANTKTPVDWTQLGRRVFTYRTGDSFGETAMFSNDATRTASAVAVGPCEVCELHRDVYRRTLSKYHQQFFEQAQKINFLQRVPLFRELQRHKLVALADVLHKKRLDFGDTFLTEQTETQYVASPPLRQCFLVLSGVVKLTQTVEVPSHHSTLNPVEEAAIAPPSFFGGPRKKKPVAHVKIELQTIVSNEIVALEALLEPQATPTSSNYSATVGSAHVELYVLKESDARAFIGGANSALGQRIRQICANEAAYRERRRKQTHLTLLQNVQEAADISDLGQYTRAENLDSIDREAMASQSPRVADTANQWSHAPPGLQVLKTPPAISEGSAPYLPNLRGSNLFPNGLTQSPRDCKAMSTLSSDLSVVSSPKILSSCVRKFLFEHSDTLTMDYVERLSHQFPSPPPPLQLAGCVVATKTQREEQRVLNLQLSKMYDSKVHWDAKKRDFVVASSTSRSTWPSPRAGFLSITPRCSGPVNVPTTANSRPPSQESSTGRRTNTFQQELRSTQQVARRLVENHLKRVGQRPLNPSADSNSESGGTFLHFFADS